jgi:hypothetical protein
MLHIVTHKYKRTQNYKHTVLGGRTSISLALALVQNLLVLLTMTASISEGEALANRDLMWAKFWTIS